MSAAGRGGGALAHHVDEFEINEVRKVQYSINNWLLVMGDQGAGSLVVLLTTIHLLIS